MKHEEQLVIDGVWHTAPFLTPVTNAHFTF